MKHSDYNLEDMPKFSKEKNRLSKSEVITHIEHNIQERRWLLAQYWLSYLLEILEEDTRRIKNLKSLGEERNWYKILPILKEL